MLERLVPNVRQLSADDLDIGVRAQAARAHTSSLPDAPQVEATDPRVEEIIRLARIYGGVLLSGPPGTSKSYYAAAAAAVMSGGHPSRVRFVQFHASYQYEDFVLGFSPTETGFTTKPGPFLALVEAACEDADHEYVLVVDELSRADVGRVFGEALTYVERSKREQEFTVANGIEIRVPNNLVILATMNPFDRGVDEVDAAFERRFAKVTMDPDPAALTSMLEANGMDPTLQARLLAWFRSINERARNNPAAAVGHAYFVTASDEESLRDIWNYQLQYLVQRAFRREESTRADVTTRWHHIFDAVGTSNPGTGS